MLSLTLLDPGDYTQMPWKNGGGTTREIAKREASGGFLWRASIATIAGSGPFSAFPGYERFIVPIAGSTLTLTIDGHVHRLSPLIPHRFSGEASTSCTLANDGNATDFNLMVRRDAYEAQVQAGTLQDAAVTWRLQGGVLLVYAVSGPLRLGLASRTVSVGTLCLNAGQSMICEGPLDGVLEGAGQSFITAFITPLS